MLGIVVSAAMLFLSACSCSGCGNQNKGDGSDDEKYEKIDLYEGFSGKVNQWSETLGTVKRKIPAETKNEGLSGRYPTYGTSLSDITDEEKDNILKETSLILASDTTYDSIGEDGTLYLKGEPTGKKLYKHTAAVGMYYGDVSDSEDGVIERVTITANEQRNFVTGIYVPAGEVVKIEISESDLAAIGGELLVYVGQVSHRNNINNIWKARNDFSRMPVIANKLAVKTTTAYVGNPLGGPVFLYPSSFGKTFTVTISGGVKYAHYIHGQTTREETERMKNYSAPYYDFEVWDLGVRMSGPSKYGNYDYDNLVKVGDLWEKIVRTSRQVPCSANATIGVGYVYDCFVAAGSACAFQGGHSWINAPCSWMSDALNYDSFVENGSWGNIHEYNHLYQSYGMENSKTNEVTNNATSLLSYSLYTKISEKRSLSDSDLTGWNRYTDPSRSLRETLAGAEAGNKQNSLNAYADLIHAFGTDVFTEAARLQTGFGVDAWYEALSLATDYNFTYYFEKLLGQTISDEMKALYDLPERITFVPVATIFQTGRSFYRNGREIFSETVRPYRIERGTPVDIDFSERLILPEEFGFSIVSVSEPESGTIEKLGENLYRYTPGKRDDSGKIEVVVRLSNATYSTKNVTLALQFTQYDKNQVEISKYTFDGETKYSSVDEAVENGFAGYTGLETYKSGSTFVNGLKNGQIGVVEGKIYIEKTGEYAFCLRSGRGNNTLYLSVNDAAGLEQVLSLNTDHGGFSLEGEHVVKRSLSAGDYLYFKEITLSRHYADAFSELGMAYLGDPAPAMKTVATNVLCTNGMAMPSKEFSSPEKYKREYAAGELSSTDTSSHTLVDVNMDSWSDGEKIGNLFDGNPDTYYHNARNHFVSEENPFILTADIGETGTYNGITIVSRKSGQYNLPSTFLLSGSEDGETWETLGKFTDLPLSGNTVSASFENATFRYYRLFVTDTKSATQGNKYVTIASIRFTFRLSGEEKSPYAFGYYGKGEKTFSERETVSSFGKLIEGNGIAKGKFTGTGFAFFVRQSEPCVVRVTVDGTATEISLKAEEGKTLAFSAAELGSGTHEVTIEVISGRIAIDSFVYAS